MNRRPEAYIELNLDDLVEDTSTDALSCDGWFDAKTVRLDFDRPALSAEAKLVAGYLTMEEHDLFGELSIEEQERIANTLKR